MIHINFENLKSRLGIYSLSAFREYEETLILTMNNKEDSIKEFIINSKISKEVGVKDLGYHDGLIGDINGIIEHLNRVETHSDTISHYIERRTSRGFIVENSIISLLLPSVNPSRYNSSRGNLGYYTVCDRLSLSYYQMLEGQQDFCKFNGSFYYIPFLGKHFVMGRELGVIYDINSNTYELFFAAGVKEEDLALSLISPQSGVTLFINENYKFFANIVFKLIKNSHKIEYFSDKENSLISYFNMDIGINNAVEKTNEYIDKLIKQFNSIPSNNKIFDSVGEVNYYIDFDDNTTEIELKKEEVSTEATTAAIPVRDETINAEFLAELLGTTDLASFTQGILATEDLSGIEQAINAIRTE